MECFEAEDDRKISIDRHKHEREDTCRHATKLNEVDQLAHDVTEGPGSCGVDDGVEGDAEEEEEEVGNGEVEDEGVGGVFEVITIAQKHSYHDNVSETTEDHDETEENRNQHLLHSDVTTSADVITGVPCS